MTVKRKVPTPEFPATVNHTDYFGYYVGGCCSLRSFHGLDQMQDPRDLVQAILESGVGGNIMILTDAYNDGAKARELEAYVKEHDLGDFTIAPPAINPYTSKAVYTAVFTYYQKDLVAHVNKIRAARGEMVWDPTDWSSPTDKVHMDDIFYELGGGVQEA